MMHPGHFFKEAVRLGESDAADNTGRLPKRRRAAEASPAYAEAEQERAEEHEEEGNDAPPPSRRHLELACEPGGMTSELPEVPRPQ